MSAQYVFQMYRLTKAYPPDKEVLKDVTLTKQASTVQVALRWQTEACLTVEVPRPPRSYDARRTSAAVVARIRALAPDHTDRQLAEQLNMEGWRSGRGRTPAACRA